ncbi:xanthine dehydrogenase family protein molybdopterin-binding subunit [Paracoccus seriniphilus]|uniref:Tat (Twin-arginine translocation) pathway signal sequence n=1 Tax=Paracoccus seriniphilus TaxID=184748 RepID=A0A239Q0L1_9RHOB|nr:molybdopterin cofactor-binding domain-containing protein [Paracoccus seriniphilus]SNT75793.1 Tat (twin-arginine translocation) pathway signal sequence [Paracoccus seriniphilus]
MPHLDISRRSFLAAAAALGVTAAVRPLGQAQAAMMPSPVGQDSGWFANGQLRYRRDGMAKVTGSKVFAIDIRARDLAGWPDEQSHGLTLHVPRADRIYLGLDLSMLEPDLAPDVLLDAARLKADGVEMPDSAFYGDFFLPEGQVPPMIGQPVALGIWHDYERFRAARKKLQFNDRVFRFGAKADQPARAPYGAARFVRIGGDDPRGRDRFSPMQNTTVWPDLTTGGVQWPDASHPAFGEAMRHSREIRATMETPPEGWHVFAREFKSQSVDPAAMEPENGLGWYADGKLHVVGATQSPYAAAHHIMDMVSASSFALNDLDFVTGYTVGYGQKEHQPFPYYVAMAALYGQGRPVRVALDRWQHFQFALKRHPFDIRTGIAVDSEGHFQIMTCDAVGDGGGVMNFSPSVGTVAVTAAQSIYYLPKSDLSVEVLPSTSVTSGSMRGYGTLQSMASTEMLVDEIAAEMKIDPIELRRRNVIESGMKNTQGAVPSGHLRAGEILELAAQDPLWTGRDQRKQEFEAENPGKRYGIGFAAVQKDFGTGAEAAVVQLEVTPEGRLKMRHVAAEIGAGATTSQMLVAEPFLGRPADEVEFSVQDWPQMPVHTKDEPYTTSQEEEDQLAQDPTWVPRFTSPRSASNSAYYFTHATQQAAQLLLRLGLWPAALSIWGEGPDGGQMRAEPVSLEDAEWRNGMLVARSMEPLSLERLSARAHRDGRITGVCVHTFNRWAWAEADFEVDGQQFRAAIDALSVKWGQGANPAQKAAMTDGGYAFRPRIKAHYPPVQRNNAGTVYYAPCASLVELAVSTGSGKVELLNHKTWLECGTQIVPELVSGQLQGGVAMGIGHALFEELPTDGDGPGNGTWNFSRYHLPRASEVAVWSQSGHVLPALSADDPPKGMAEVVMIPVVAASINAIAHATGHRFYQMPVTAARIKEVL